MSWMHLKTLSDDTKNWGIKKKKNDDTFIIMFESVLKRCGGFLTHLIFDASYMEKDIHIANLIKTECPNLQDIDLRLKSSVYLGDIKAIKPIFCNVREFAYKIEKKVTDGDLGDLFSMNDKLEHLHLDFDSNEGIFANTLSNALLHETIRELSICSEAIPFHSICNVSYTCQRITFLKIRI